MYDGQKGADVNAAKEISDAVSEIISGGRIVRRAGKWLVGTNEPGEILFVWRNHAFYGFKIAMTGASVTLLNYHMEIEAGEGKKSLKELEMALQEYATTRHTETTITFPSLGHFGTEEWLAKNGYSWAESREGNRTYSKIISPKARG